MNMTPPESDPHWASKQEKGNRLSLRITAFLAMHCPVFLLKYIILIVVAYYYLISKEARHHIRDYQQALAKTFPELLPALNKRSSVLKQFFAFGESIVDRFSVWQKKIQYRDLVVHDEDRIYHDIEQKGQRGQIFLCSHLGNIEVARALVNHFQDFSLTILMHSKHAVEFNKSLAKAGADYLDIIEISALDADMMMHLHQKIEQGGWIAIAADRVSLNRNKCTQAMFLGRSALWAQGPWLLASLLKAPVNVLFCLKEDGQYHLHLKRFAKQIVLKRSQRDQSIQAYIQAYADLLASMCRRSPWQWFNFYQFWNQDE